MTATVENEITTTTEVATEAVAPVETIEAASAEPAKEEADTDITEPAADDAAAGESTNVSVRYVFAKI